MYRNIVFIILLLAISSFHLAAQKYRSGNKIFFNKGQYHTTSGWFNSSGGYIGDIAWYIAGSIDVGATLSTQIDLQRYKLVKPRLGIGGGVAYKRIATEQLGYEEYDHYKFVDVYAYVKKYLNDKRLRLYVDTKLGVGLPVGKTSYGCYGCDELTSVIFNFSPGVSLQPGFGFDLPTAYKTKVGFRFGVSLNIVNSIEESYLAYEAEPYKSTEEVRRVIPGLLSGINLYF